MLTSLFENNKDIDLHIHLIADNLSKKSEDLIIGVIRGNYGQEISFYNVNETLLKDFKIYGESHISIATYYRIFLESLLPPTIDKVIYLDCDMIITKSIKELWDTDINEFAVGCVEDMWSGKKDNYIRLNYDENYSYFNAGVLLINLRYWRKMGLEKKALKYINDNPNKLIFNDQDVLNGLLYDKKKFLPLRWNMQDGFFRTKRNLRKSSYGILNSEIHKRVIIHYTGSKKPWQFKSQHPLKKDYFYYMDLTIWKGERPKIPFLYKLKLIIDKSLNMLHFTKLKYITIDK